MQFTRLGHEIVKAQLRIERSSAPIAIHLRTIACYVVDASAIALARVLLGSGAGRKKLSQPAESHERGMENSDQPQSRHT
jgi:hypothetical protein